MAHLYGPDTIAPFQINEAELQKPQVVMEGYIIRAETGEVVPFVQTFDIELESTD